jgi:hypothetical protein
MASASVTDLRVDPPFGGPSEVEFIAIVKAGRVSPNHPVCLECDVHTPFFQAAA